MAGRNAWAPSCGARTRAGSFCRARVVVGPEGPRSRCRMHGGHLKSGKQTPEGRRRISEAVSKRMRAFWEAWRAAASPPLAWREALRTARAKPKSTPAQPTIVTPAERRQRAIAELKRLRPEQDWDCISLDANESAPSILHTRVRHGH